MTDPAGDAMTAIRDRVRAVLDVMSAEQRHRASCAACTRLAGLEAFVHASVIMLYMPLIDEIDTTPAAIRCFQMGKTVCVPRVDWRRLDITAVEVSSFDNRYMETDEHGVRTPGAGRPLVPSTVDLVVVPGLAFDTHGHRVGRVGDCYDRFLVRLRRSAARIGLAFDGQIVDRIPAGKGQVRLDTIVTDRRVTRTSASRTRR